MAKAKTKTKSPGVFATLLLAGKRFKEQDMTHHAAALTYYTVLSLFPALLVGVALLGLLGSSATVSEIGVFLTENGADQQLVDGVTTSVQSAVQAKSGSIIALIIGIAFAINGASGAMGALTKALNITLEVEDKRGFIKKKAQTIAITIVLLVLALGAVLAVFVGGTLADGLFSAIGLGEQATDVWGYLRYPAGLILAMTAFAWVYYAATTAPEKRFRWISLGAAVAVVIWMAGSLGFFFYVSNFGSYNATYGVFATAIILLVWLWLTNMAVLFGAEINAAGRYEEGITPPLSKEGVGPEEAARKVAISEESETASVIPSAKQSLLSKVVVGGVLLLMLRKTK